MDIVIRSVKYYTKFRLYFSFLLDVILLYNYYSIELSTFLKAYCYIHITKIILFDLIIDNISYFQSFKTWYVEYQLFNIDWFRPSLTVFTLLLSFGMINLMFENNIESQLLYLSFYIDFLFKIIFQIIIICIITISLNITQQQPQSESFPLNRVCSECNQQIAGNETFILTTDNTMIHKTCKIE